MLIRYNTPEYRKLFKSYESRYHLCDKVVCIEDRVREICANVYNANLGVSVWSCEGHDDPHDMHAGYIMFSPRNREAATILMDMFQQISGVLIDLYGWDAGMEIEHDLAMINDATGEQHAYPCLTIRNNPGMTEHLANLWWTLVTKGTGDLLRSRIELQAAIKSSVNKETSHA